MVDKWKEERGSLAFRNICKINYTETCCMVGLVDSDKSVNSPMFVHHPLHQLLARFPGVEVVTDPGTLVEVL